ncbi:MAG: hypothetical protein FD171_761 [Actinobacteria bacterium]|nr:MAG: hypothetical protein FD171_761 [Actinomycetota bacterium]
MDEEWSTCSSHDGTHGPEVIEVTMGQHDSFHRTRPDSCKQLGIVPRGIHDDQRPTLAVAHEEAVGIQGTEDEPLDVHEDFFFDALASGIARRASKTPPTPRTALSTFVSWSILPNSRRKRIVAIP